MGKHKYKHKFNYDPLNNGCYLIANRNIFNNDIKYFSFLRNLFRNKKLKFRKNDPILKKFNDEYYLLIEIYNLKENHIHDVYRKISEFTSDEMEMIEYLINNKMVDTINRNECIKDKNCINKYNII